MDKKLINNKELTLSQKIDIILLKYICEIQESNNLFGIMEEDLDKLNNELVDFIEQLDNV